MKVRIKENLTGSQEMNWEHELQVPSENLQYE